MISSLELAKLCGVSHGTVDRALHNRPGISLNTKARILAMAEQHGYVPHPAAREIIARTSPQVGAIVPFVNHPFFMDLMDVAQRICLTAELRLLIAPVTGEEEFFKVLTDFAARRFRAAIVVPPRAGLALPSVGGNTFRVATVLESCSGDHTRYFAPNEVSTGQNAVEYLVKQGHRRILHLTHPLSSTVTRDRAKGYQLAMEAHSLEPMVYTSVDPQVHMKTIERFRPSAVFCHNDLMALTLIRALTNVGLRIPEDISVLGVDDSPTFTELFQGITTMRYPITEVVEGAFAWLLLGKEPDPIPIPRVIERTTVRRFTATGE